MITKEKENVRNRSKRKMMRTAVFVAPQIIEVQDLDIPEPKEGQVLVRLEGCGVCASNIPVFQGREWFNYPLQPGAPGHEGWGIIEEVGGNVQNFQKGDRVTFLSGSAYASYDLVEENKLVKLPGSLNGKFFPGEPLACAVNIFERCDIKAGHTVAIIGIGFLGSLLIQLAKNAGAKVIAISRRETALDRAAEFDADEIIKMDDHWRIIEEVKQITKENLCDRVIEAIGFQWPLDLAAELVKGKGRLIIAGYHQEARQVNMQMWNRKGIEVINAHERDPEVCIKGIQKAIKYVEEGIITPNPLFTNIYELEDIQQAFEDLIGRPDGFIKAIIINK